MYFFHIQRDHALFSLLVFLCVRSRCSKVVYFNRKQRYYTLFLHLSSISFCVRSSDCRPFPAHSGFKLSLLLLRYVFPFETRWFESCVSSQSTKRSRSVSYGRGQRIHAAGNTETQPVQCCHPTGCHFWRSKVGRSQENAGQHCKK